MIFKIFLIVVALLAMLKTYRQYRRKEQSLYWFIISSIFWALVILVAFLPQWADVVARTVGVERGADLLVYIAVVILSYGLYRTIVQQERTRREITELTRQIALKDARKKKSHE